MEKRWREGEKKERIKKRKIKEGNKGSEQGENRGQKKKNKRNQGEERKKGEGKGKKKVTTCEKIKKRCGISPFRRVCRLGSGRIGLRFWCACGA